MHFVKYQSLENHYREKTIAWIERNIERNESWVVTEKVDGANFAFYYDGAEMRVASRKQFVDGTFYACAEVIKDYSNYVKEIWEMIPNKREEEFMILRGELCGKGIQNRVDYGEKKFIAFGLDVVTKLDTDEWRSYTYDYEFFERYCKKINLPYIKPLLISTFNDCMKFPNDGNSGIIEKEDNIMEGVVIRGFHRNFRNQFCGQIIIKSKNEKFTEKSAKIRVKKPAMVYENIKEILGYINSNRLDAVLSKLGGLDALTQKDFGKILGLFSKDVIEDLLNDELLPVDYRKLDKWKDIGKCITRESQPLLKDEVLNKL